MLVALAVIVGASFSSLDARRSSGDSVEKCETGQSLYICVHKDYITVVLYMLHTGHKYLCDLLTDLHTFMQ